MATTATTRTVFVVSWVYWNGDEQGGGGFNWYEAADREHAESHHDQETAGWGDTPIRVRLVEMQVPAHLTGDELTAWIDDDIDQIEFHLPALRTYTTEPAESQQRYLANVQQDPDDETVTVTGESLPYGRCDTCGRPVGPMGCVADTAHPINLDGHGNDLDAGKE